MRSLNHCSALWRIPRVSVNGDWYYEVHFNPQSLNFVPEPATWALMIMGFAGVGAALRNRRKGLVAA